MEKALKNERTTTLPTIASNPRTVQPLPDQASITGFSAEAADSWYAGATSGWLGTHSLESVATTVPLIGLGATPANNLMLFSNGTHARGFGATTGYEGNADLVDYPTNANHLHGSPGDGAQLSGDNLRDKLQRSYKSAQTPPRPNYGDGHPGVPNPPPSLNLPSTPPSIDNQGTILASRRDFMAGAGGSLGKMGYFAQQKNESDAKQPGLFAVKTLASLDSPEVQSETLAEYGVEGGSIGPPEPGAASTEGEQQVSTTRVAATAVIIVMEAPPENNAGFFNAKQAWGFPNDVAEQVKKQQAAQAEQKRQQEAAASKATTKPMAQPAPAGNPNSERLRSESSGGFSMNGSKNGLNKVAGNVTGAVWDGMLWTIDAVSEVYMVIVVGEKDADGDRIDLSPRTGFVDRWLPTVPEMAGDPKAPITSYRAESKRASILWLSRDGREQLLAEAAAGEHRIRVGIATGGVLQIVEGVGEIAIGLVLVDIPGGGTQVVGLIALGHGSDHLIAGIRTLDSLLNDDLSKVGVQQSGTSMALGWTAGQVFDLTPEERRLYGDLLDGAVSLGVGSTGAVQIVVTRERAFAQSLAFNRELRGGGSWLLTEEQYNLYVRGRPLVGRPDGQFIRAIECRPVGLIIALVSKKERTSFEAWRVLSC